ncbi:NTP transferase domain-containing protein [Methanohalobium sp.]|uniref:NTP transferase domain-containing protein n=1 Tax=Methanohalobium sp. TaxID=2837493 RepID=UPI0025E7A001|nr:NTP transferase domain-containing protein [Methanohalobium sp.]
MDVIVMAGGRGTRLGMGEKPCVQLLGFPLISYVIDALEKAENIDNIYVAVSQATPNTEIYVSNQYQGRVNVIETAGGDYVGDMIYAVENAGIKEPVMIIMSDLALITPELIDKIVDEYRECNKPALSVHVPISVCKNLGIRPDTVFHRDGNLIVPTGVNILDGKYIKQEQDDYNLIMDYPELALNINTANDLERCKNKLMERSGQSSK